MDTLGDRFRRKHRNGEVSFLATVRTWLHAAIWEASRFTGRHWLGIGIIAIATTLYFWPILMRIDSYNPGGDSMFNAWTLARDQHCILGQGCPNYADGNIYFPNTYTMLYSETQLSAGLLTLPLFWIDSNPIFSFNVWTIASIFFAALFMYLLAMFLSRGNRILSTLAGLMFAYAPFKLFGISHTQNLSIFYLPLAVLLILKFVETRATRYLVWLLVTLLLLFYASWYQMVFALFGICGLVVVLLAMRFMRWRQAALLGITVLSAVIATLPLAIQYVQFSKANNAKFSIPEQVFYSSSLLDYISPYGDTLLGKIVKHINPGLIHNYNPDSVSFHGIATVLVAVLGVLLLFLFRRRSVRHRRWYALAVGFAFVGVVGFILSLGPLLKITAKALYPTTLDVGGQIVIPLPWLLIDKLFPQLLFIRAIGRASVLCLFAICCLLALVGFLIQRNQTKRYLKHAVAVAIVLIAAVELMPMSLNRMADPNARPYAYNLRIPAVYQYIKDRPEIDKIVVVAGDADYPKAPFPIQGPETAMWAGYMNRSVFNGYSGYTPPQYHEQYSVFQHFDAKALVLAKSLGLNYLIVDKQLSTSHPELLGNVERLVPNKIYEDERYALLEFPWA